MPSALVNFAEEVMTNPATGQPYTYEELEAIAPTPPTVEEQTQTNLENAPVLDVEEPSVLPEAPEITPAPIAEAPELAPAPGVTPAPEFGAPEVPTMPGVTAPPKIPQYKVEDAPEYEKTPEQLAWEEMYSGTVKEIIEQGGRGIDDKTQQLMLRKATLMLQSRETENLRLMRDDLERRGISNSGILISETQKIKATTTRALAASITDVQIKSALMKMQSFENTLGHAGNYLAYLADQSKMAHVPKMATWQMQQNFNLVKYQAEIQVDIDAWKMENQFNMMEWQANTNALFAKWEANANATMSHWTMENQFAMTEWTTGAAHEMEAWKTEGNWKMAEWATGEAAKIDIWKTEGMYNLEVSRLNMEIAISKWSAQSDIYKMGIAQAYDQDNLILAGEIESTFLAEQQEHDIVLAEMEIEHEKAQAQAEGAGSFIGQILGGILKLITA